jgi:hypothetical protein
VVRQLLTHEQDAKVGLARVWPVGQELIPQDAGLQLHVSVPEKTID